jgi:hypothetical protein
LIETISTGESGAGGRGNVRIVLLFNYALRRVGRESEGVILGAPNDISPPALGAQAPAVGVRFVRFL